jgi:hypothetical protein
MSTFGIGLTEPEELPSTEQLMESIDFASIPGMKSVPINPDTNKPIFEDPRTPLKKAYVRMFTLSSAHQKYMGLSTGQRLQIQLEASMNGGKLTGANGRIIQVGVSATEIGTGIWSIWSGTIGLVYGPDTPVSLRSKKAFFSDGLMRAKCYQDALDRLNAGENPDFRKVHRDAARASNAKSLFDSERTGPKFRQMTLRQQQQIPCLPTKSQILGVLREADPKFKPKNLGNPTTVKTDLSRKLIRQGECDRFLRILPGLEKMEKKGKKWSVDYLKEAEEIERAPEEYGYPKYAGKPALPTNEVLIMPDKPVAIILPNTHPETCRWGLALRERHHQLMCANAPESEHETLPFATYDGATGDLVMHRAQWVAERSEEDVESESDPE